MSGSLNSKNGTPVLPSKRQYQDPTRQGSKRKYAERKFNKRVRAVKSGIKELISNLARVRKTSSNGLQLLREASLKDVGFILNNSDKYYFTKKQTCCGNYSLIKEDFENCHNILNPDNVIVANRVYDYEITPSIMNMINATIDNLLNEQYLDNFTNYNNQFWLDEFIRSSYLNGAQDAYNSAANVTAKQASAALAASLKEVSESSSFIAGQLNRASLVGSRTFENMKGLTALTRADLSATLFDGMRRGLGVIELTNNVVARVGVSHSRGTRIVRTEINQAYRQSTRRETDVLNDDVYGDSGFSLVMLWFSALTSTTRRTHARRHGKTYTTEAVDSFYSKDANEINCYCSQSQVLVDDKTGEVFQSDLMAQMTDQRKEYFKEDPEERPPVVG